MSKARFQFGENWENYLRHVDEEKVARAISSLSKALQVNSLEGLRFLDAGCGSGLFSLAAVRLGAHVHSFDCDERAVACAQSLKEEFAPSDSQWNIEQGSVLDRNYMESLGKFDVVYSWGVLHHTGDMREAMDMIHLSVKAGASLYISIYNDMGRSSERWKFIKRFYVEHPLVRPLLLAYGFVRMRSGWLAAGLLEGSPFRRWHQYSRECRGMTPWVDLVDWVGGYPYEYMKPEEVFKFYRAKGFRLQYLKTAGCSYGCNEFVFVYDQGGCA